LPRSEIPPLPPGVDKAVVTVVLRGPGPAREVLLLKRRDFRIFDLPGGCPEPGEAREDAARREAEEETGYQVGIDRFVGEYWRPRDPGGGTLIFVFVAHVVGGALLEDGPETVTAGWFSPDKLPFTLFAFCAEYVRDALRAQPPVRRTQLVPWRVALPLRAAFSLRNRLHRFTRAT
jgi:8-oxo-dGTP diphosphatase